jgi:hypothetical protein
MSDRMWRFYEKANAVVRTFTGPAQLGDGRPEPALRPAEYTCPLCGSLMSEHRIERAGDAITPTRLHCPR